MKVREITDRTIELLRTGRYRFGRLNFPSGDMVGHTGSLPAAIKAVETVDTGLGRIAEAIAAMDGRLR
jgi:2,3-bisphosphoglycerate-independent phosphoglycerate mutase